MLPVLDRNFVFLYFSSSGKHWNQNIKAACLAAAVVVAATGSVVGDHHLLPGDVSEVLHLVLLAHLSDLCIALATELAGRAAGLPPGGPGGGGRPHQRRGLDRGGERADTLQQVLQRAAPSQTTRRGCNSG